MKHPLLVTAITISTISIAQKRDYNFDAHWLSFSKAMLALELTGLYTLTAYPINARGPMDSDPINKIDSGHIVAALKKFLPVDGGVGDGTHEQMIESRIIINNKDYEYNSPANMRVGDMQFRKIKGKWKFYFIYLNE
ncbi:MAG: hypothetical protein ABIX01_15320 [Chitinophagaceae bacterium]